MIVNRCLPVLLVLFCLLAMPRSADAEDYREVLERLNQLPTVDVSERIRSYRTFFDGYLNLTRPPERFGRGFRAVEVHPKMSGWNDLSNWAEANLSMAEVLINASERPVFGLPYGASNVPSEYRENNLFAAVGDEAGLNRISFPYTDAVRRAQLFGVTEIHRRMKSGQVDEALDLTVAMLFFLRQLCDREFFEEKEFAIQSLIDMLITTRNVFYMYREKISADQYRNLAISEIPFLRPDRNALFMPEADRIVAEAILREVFDRQGQPIPERFREMFATIQSRDEPLTRFGASRRWEKVAARHDSLDASLQRLRLVYDDWWRRWRVQEYDPILEDFPSEFERTNEVRFAAVIFSIKDLQQLFALRRQLIAQVNGTGMAAGICGYYRTYNTWPRGQRRLYAAHCRKVSDLDPYDRNMGTFLFIYPESRHTMDTPAGRIQVPAGMAILYSRGVDGSNERAAEHTDDGLSGDLVIWPPYRALAWEQGVRN